MAEVTAALVKDLRETSGAGMMDCKRALTETGGDIDAAIDWLRTKGLSKAAKKADRVAAEGLGRKIAMHVAATNPLSLSVEDLDPAAVAKERAIFTEQAIASGKPPQVAEKMVEGRLRKFYEEVTLLKQAFVMDSDLTIEQLVEKVGKELGSPLKVKGFVRLALGEGVEKGPSGDFAAEVAAMTGQA